MSYTLLKETYPKARKRHVCIWCGEKIEQDEIYRREKSVFDGGIQDHKWHLNCDEDAQETLCLDETFIPYSNDRPK